MASSALQRWVVAMGCGDAAVLSCGLRHLRFVMFDLRIGFNEHLKSLYFYFLKSVD